MDWLSEYASYCTEINATTTDYSTLANAIGGSEARCFIDKEYNLWITTSHPQDCTKTCIDTVVDEYNKSHNYPGCSYILRIIEEKDKHTITQNFGAFCFSVWHVVPISN